MARQPTSPRKTQPRRDPRLTKEHTGGTRRKPTVPEVSPEARRKQVIVALVMGAIMGTIVSAATQFWLWLPAGLALGLAVGYIMKPPES